MATEVLLDTNYLLAWHREKDELHPRAEKVRETLAEARPFRIVLDCVYSELVAVLARTRVKEEDRPQNFLREEILLRKTYWDKLVRMAYIGGTNLLRRAIGVSREAAKEHGAGISPHDAMILIFAHEREVPFLVSFDEDFKKVETVEGEGLDVTIVNDENRGVLLK
ncbi:hypothetical protein AKJ45_02065 [candidate division MSBL1 archaeon SCGC-AAA261F19]|uniref:PIN domain-containing protein n=1 Tax=candidate division MSBL1 archaeon SCGC-AAA261F19 TaxID=1698275 RepID=A0A133VA39_9EURY|nr:hypothetical protein AKJ45_02065 [candidate division MSBL1 archaeon SCGC-AAA261F19]